MNLTQDQTSALDTKHHIFVEAGAGTGKTRILVERYLKILLNNPELDLSAIVAFTFTQKAAQEMILRIQETARSNTRPLSETLREKISDQLHTAPISTIHQFCLRCLKKYPLEAQIDPDIDLLDPLHANYIFRKTIQEVLTEEIQKESQEIQSLLEIATFQQIKTDIHVFANNHSFLSNETLINQPKKTLTETKNTPHYEPTKSAFNYIQTLHTIYLTCQKRYEDKKQRLGKCDFEDLIQKTLKLIQNHPKIQTQLQKTHPFLMVDEFQDTDPLQWQLITALTGSPIPEKYKINLFLVGDLKQSIYSFRGARETGFINVKNQFKKASQCTRLITLKDNFRSHKNLMESINTLFSDIFPIPTNESEKISTNVPYHALKGHQENPSGGYLHTCFIPQKKQDIMNEIHVILEWIQKHQKNNPHTKLEDIAILCRRKTYMETIKKTLEIHQVPCQILSQQNLYQNQAIIDCFAILEIMIDPQKKLSWRTLLRSPFFRWSESEIYTLFHTHKHQNIPYRLLNPPETLSNDLKEKWEHTSQCCQNLLKKAKEMPLSFGLNWLLNETGAWATYSQEKNGDTLCGLIEQFIKKCQNLETEPMLTNMDILKILEDSIQENEREKEEDNLPRKNHVSILSIHGSKGLEFPIVIIPECGQKFNFASRNRLLFSSEIGPGLKLKIKENENQHRIKVRHHQETLTIEEEKRLFYVACTRAIDHLLLIGHLNPEKVEKNTYLNFLTQIGFIETNTSENKLKLRHHIKFSYPLNPSTITPSPQMQSCATQHDLPTPIQPKTSQLSALSPSIQHPPLRTPQLLGTISHQALQQLIQNPSHSKQDITNNVIHQNLIPEHQKITIQQHVLRHLETLEKHPIYPKLLTVKNLETEKPFTYKTKKGLRKGRIDLIFQEKNTLFIIDFKTSQSTPDAYQKRKESYKDQVQKYAEALSNSYPNILEIKTIIIQTYLNKTDSWIKKIK